MQQIATTERLLLREFTLLDASFILELVNDPTFLENIGDKKVRNLEDAKKHIRNNLVSSYSNNGYGAYVVQLKDNTPIGLCGFFKRAQFDYPDIGYAFLPRFTGVGYAEEACQAVMRYGKEKLSFTKVLAFTSLDNHASSRLLEKIGLRFQEIIIYGEKKEEVRLYVSDALDHS
jgi:RimJ/RimL family protein N-acetyltransferase